MRWDLFFPLIPIFSTFMYFYTIMRWWSICDGAGDDGGDGTGLTLYLNRTVLFFSFFFFLRLRCCHHRRWCWVLLMLVTLTEFYCCRNQNEMRKSKSFTLFARGDILQTEIWLKKIHIVNASTYFIKCSSC